MPTLQDIAAIYLRNGFLEAAKNVHYILHERGDRSPEFLHAELLLWERTHA